MTAPKVYHGEWEDEGLPRLVLDFQIDLSALDGATILYARYDYPDYEGSALVIGVRAGKLFEVNAGHCSCYGLETQWEEEETSLAALAKRLRPGGWLYASSEEIVAALKPYFGGELLAEGGGVMAVGGGL